jgi:hypothetical protein
MHNITYDVRIYKTEVYKGSTVTTYRARWKTGPQVWREQFRNKAQATSFGSRTTKRRAEGRGVRHHHRTPRLLGPDQGRYELVRLLSRLRGHEVERLIGKAPR